MCMHLSHFCYLLLIEKFLGAKSRSNIVPHDEMTNGLQSAEDGWVQDLFAMLAQSVVVELQNCQVLYPLCPPIPMSYKILDLGQSGIGEFLLHHYNLCYHCFF